MTPEFFTRYGGFIFVLSQVASAVTAMLATLIFWGLLAMPEFGWIIGNERSSSLLPTAIAAIFNGVLDAQGSAARPHGPGTGKWLFIDAFFSFLKAVPLLLAAGLLAKGELIGTLLDLAIVLAMLVVVDAWNWLASFFLEAKPVTTPPPTI